jgi:hypothetical protein
MLAIGEVLLKRASLREVRGYLCSSYRNKVEQILARFGVNRKDVSLKFRWMSTTLDTNRHKTWARIFGKRRR